MTNPEPLQRRSRSSALGSGQFVRHSAFGICLLILGFPAWAAEPVAGPAAACPKGAIPVGTVTARLGTFVVLAVRDGAAVRPGEEFLAGRPALLVTLAKGAERVEAWGDWQEAGRVLVRATRGARGAIAFVTADTPRTGPRGEPAPNIRPGDILYRPLGSSAPAEPKPSSKKPGPG